MILIVGLGNPGEKYAHTRHNIGFMVVDELARKISTFNFQFSVDRKSNAEILKIKHGDKDVILAKPQTMMNASGFAVKKLTNFYKLEPSSVWVIHDDLDLPLGKIKIAVGHRSAGHHGIDSIVEHLGTNEFVRFRVGIGHPAKGDTNHLDRNEVIEYVLRDFEGKELTEAKKAIKKTVKAIVAVLEKGLPA